MVIRENAYLYLEPYTNVFFSNGKVLVYNTIDGSSIIVEDEKNIELLAQLTEDDNLYCVLLEMNQLNDPIISEFITSLQNTFMGDVVRQSLVKSKPHQLTPILNFQRDLDRFKKKLYTSIGDDVMKYLFELSIYINGNSKHNLKNINKQLSFPIAESASNIPIEYIRKISNELQANTFGNINILGGDISTHPELEMILDILEELNMKKTLHIYYQDELLDISGRKNFEIKFHIDYPIKKEVDFLLLKSMGIHFCFVIQSIEDLKITETIVKENRLVNHSFEPYYNGTNIEFFEDNIYMNEEDILEVKPNQNDIFSNMKINKNNFGKLVVLSNGEVYANINKNLLGNIKDSTFHSLIFTELCGNDSWKDVRRKVDSCISCVYNCLCPPLSNYEYFLGRNNLCNIND